MSNLLDLRVDYATPIPTGCGLEAQVECHYAGEFSAHLHGVIRALNDGVYVDAIVAQVTGIFAINTPGRSAFSSEQVIEGVK